MPHRETKLQSDLAGQSATRMLVEVINEANRIFGERHNWLSPLTSEQEREQFVARCCAWWNDLVCPAMDRLGAVWNEARQRFEMPGTGCSRLE